MVAPAGTPAPIIAHFNREIARFLDNPEIRQRMIAFGPGRQRAAPSESTGEFIRADQERWRNLVKELGIEPQ